MIQVLVHQHRPLVRRERPEEGVRLLRARAGSARCKTIDQRDQARTLAFQVALVGHDVIWLKVSIGQASRRVGLNTARPLLMGNMRARLIELLRERTPVYEAVSTQVVETDGRGSSEVADQLAAERGAVL